MCPSGTKFEAEVVSMTANMLHAEAVECSGPDDGVSGAITSGGSESIMLPMLAYREQARAVRGITAPEMVVPDFLADVEAMRAAITPDTIALAGSAANYPHGLIDPLARLSEVALAHGIGMHVDACLGGFLLPWIEKLGYDVPPFDFRLPGVTSMSCYTHKWGYGLKGASVVLYRRKTLRRWQYFSTTSWPGGLYASPTMAGSRSGGITASTWASLVVHGEEGYLETTRRIMRAADTIKAGVARIPELRTAGNHTFWKKV